MGNSQSTKISINMFQTPEKNTKSGISQLGDFDETSTTTSFLPLEITKSWIMHENPFAVVIHNVLTHEECQKWIEETELVGYGEALVNIGGGLQRKMTDVRNSSRCIVDDADRAAELWMRVKRFIPLNLITGYEQVELNERLRFLRYDEGEYFAPHLDGNYRRERNHERAGDKSFLTLQVYLNEGFEGGSTRFFHRSEDEVYHDVVPRTGSVLIFEHPILHSGERLERGRKYAIRTDVMFTRCPTAAVEASEAGEN
jgi:predicted 2-oxoglutarate/Fe(II)-dependent dioxygenase YbiX